MTISESLALAVARDAAVRAALNRLALAGLGVSAGAGAGFAAGGWPAGPFPSSDPPADLAGLEADLEALAAAVGVLADPVIIFEAHF